MEAEITNFVIAFSVLLFAFSLVSRKISGTVVTAPMIFVTAGMLLSPEGLDLIKCCISFPGSDPCRSCASRRHPCPRPMPGWAS
ncbi:Na+/H+ antiporter [Methanosarcina siciliae C2J]|nr:Na+/H+ antiporter [Methanosarcina siciliae C2J]